jgi:hypothetical protein
MENTSRQPYFDVSIEVFNQALIILGSLVEQRSHFTEKDQQLIQALATCGNTGEAIYKLLQEDTTLSEGYMLMRVLLEKLVNFHYLRCSGDSELKHYQMYPYYRYYHSLGQKVYGHTMKAQIDNPRWKVQKLQTRPPFSEALAMFSATNPTMGWTSKSFGQKVKHICEHEPTLEPGLVLSQMLAYTDASEMLHGSLWGILVLSGVFGADFKNPSKPTSDEVGKFYSKKIAEPLYALSELVLLTVRMVADDAKLSEFSKKVAAALKLFEQDDKQTSTVI